MLDVTPIPESIRAILRLSGAEKGVKKLQLDFQLWVGLAFGSFLAAILAILASLRVDSSDMMETRLLRVLLVFVGGINIVLTFFLYKEAMRRYRYVLEIRKLSATSKSLKDTIFGFLGR
ncbi:MAG: hypothetical protein ACE5OZ_05090 [Candidatus Heimdallarchaeota archaeon]